MKKHTKFPNINFHVNKEAEKDVAKYYVKEAFYSKDFSFFDKFIKNYPELAQIKGMEQKEALLFIFQKIDEYYLKEQERLEKLKTEIEMGWDKIKGEFFVEAEKLFENKWPKGKYVANISLFGMFRLVPGTKKFSVPSEDYGGHPPTSGQINMVIVHEMMHILCEDFYKKHLKGSLSKMKYYDFLEIVNYFVLNLSQFKKLTGWVAYPYPQHEVICKELTPTFEAAKSIKEFCEKAIRYLTQ